MNTIRLWTLISILLVVPTALWTKAYEGPAAGWFNNYGGGVMYVIFWSLAGFLIWPKREAIGWIVGIVVILTCGLEVLQLFDDWTLLETIRRTLPGKLLLGTTFVWWDFPHYLLGGGIGWFWL